jgi:hypothetical protein
MAEFEDGEYTENGEEDRESLDERDRYRARTFVGVGRGQPISVAVDRALDSAYRQARADGATGPLRVAEQHIWGDNPPNWCRVVLVDDGS